jgi:hypothetical protein
VSSPTDVPDFLKLPARSGGVRAKAAALVARVQATAAQAETAIAWSVGLSIAAVVLSAGALVYVAAKPRAS